jgi:hypothetical protein
MKVKQRTSPVSILVASLLAAHHAHSFLPPSSSSSSPRLPTKIGAANNTKTKKKKKTSTSTSVVGGLKGFGSSAASSSSSSSSSPAGSKSSTGGTIDRSPSALKFYDYLRRNGGDVGESNLKRVGLGYFPLQTIGDGGGDGNNNIPQLLRGVIALRDIPKGEPIIEIPYEMALDLGRERADPTLPATTLLQKYCTWRNNNGGSGGAPGDKDRGDYFAMLPPYLSEDCLGSTDFFGDAALDMLQSPNTVVEETRLRRELVKLRYERDVEPMSQISSNLYRWDIGEIATQSHLQWASWIITSRVLTVQGPPDSSAAFRLLIPLIDMCNHDRDSPHILTGRAMPGGMLKVIAGVDVSSGDAINIGYGGGVEGNDRFIQDYGFLDAGGSKERGKKGEVKGGEFVAEGFTIVAKKLLGKGRSLTKLNAAESERALEALKATSLEEDEKLLASGRVVRSDERTALEYRIGVKKALKGCNL